MRVTLALISPRCQGGQAIELGPHLGRVVAAILDTLGVPFGQQLVSLAGIAWAACGHQVRLVLPTPAMQRPHVVDMLSGITAIDARPLGQYPLVGLRWYGAGYLGCDLAGSVRVLFGAELLWFCCVLTWWAPYVGAHEGLLAIGAYALILAAVWADLIDGAEGLPAHEALAVGDPAVWADLVGAPEGVAAFGALALAGFAPFA
jgi:hypothetical protein